MLYFALGWGFVVGGWNWIQVRAQLGLDEIGQHPWNLVSSNALSGEGLDDGLRWLSDRMMDLLQKR